MSDSTAGTPAPPAGGNIELRAYMWLADLFRQRQWSNPMPMAVAPGTTGRALLAQLDIPWEKVDLMFINHRATIPSLATINPGDRVTLFPPGVLLFAEIGLAEHSVAIKEARGYPFRPQREPAP